MKILVTGGLGFIGGHLIDLISRNKDVEVQIFDFKNEYWKQSVCNEERFRDALIGVDRVYHLAALTSAPDSIKRPKKYWQVNVDGTRNLLNHFDGPLVFASSAAVHQPLNPYALTKVVGESLMVGRPKTKVCRFYNVYGEGDTKSAVYQFIKNALLGKDLIIYGDGLQTRSFIYVKDLVSHMKFTEDYKVEELCHITMTIQQLANYIVKICESKSNIIYKEKREGDPYESSHHNEILPDYGFFTGMENTVKWVRRKIFGIKGIL